MKQPHAYETCSSEFLFQNGLYQVALKVHCLVGPHRRLKNLAVKCGIWSMLSFYGVF